MGWIEGIVMVLSILGCLIAFFVVLIVLSCCVISGRISRMEEENFGHSVRYPGSSNRVCKILPADRRKPV